MARWVLASPSARAKTRRPSLGCRSMRRWRRTGGSSPPAPRRRCSMRCSPSGEIRLGGDPTTGRTTLVAIDDGRIVGVVVAGPDPVRPDRGHVARFYVVPDRWGQGIGHRLYLGALDWLGRSDYREATLWVLEGNDRARAWYERLGWRTTGERKTVYEPAGIVDLQYLIGLAEPHSIARRRRRSRPVARLEHGAMTEVRSAGTVGDLLTSRRRARFVGRTSEVELFRRRARVAGTAVRAAAPPWTTRYRQDEPARRLRRARRPTPARRWFVWTGATSSRRRRRCCRSSATCSSCRRGRRHRRTARRWSAGGPVRHL